VIGAGELLAAAHRDLVGNVAELNRAALHQRASMSHPYACRVLQQPLLHSLIVRWGIKLTSVRQ
jgi:hypothetical protein